MLGSFEFDLLVIWQEINQIVKIKCFFFVVRITQIYYERLQTCKL